MEVHVLQYASGYMMWLFCHDSIYSRRHLSSYYTNLTRMRLYLATIPVVL